MGSVLIPIRKCIRGRGLVWGSELVSRHRLHHRVLLPIRTHIKGLGLVWA